MQADQQADERLAWVERVVASPPIVHPDAMNAAVWRTQTSCYRFMAGQVQQGSRTLETGAGLSTVLFAAWGCDHLAVVPFENERDAIVEYCEAEGIERASLTFDIRPSEVALPQLAGLDELDLVFIDGCHGYPMPVIDWFYGAGLLRKGGVVVFDDVQLPQVKWLIDTIIEPDNRWQRLAATAKWMAFRRMSEGTLAESESNQPYIVASNATPWRRVKDVIPLSIKQGVKRSFHAVSSGP